MRLRRFYSEARCYLIFLTDNDGISVMLSLSDSASDGIFWNLITGCTALISDGTFNQKGNQKVIHSWGSPQSQWWHNTTCWKDLLASSPFVAIKSNWLLSSQHPPFLLQNTAYPSAVESQCGNCCSWEISKSHAEICLPLSIWLSKLSQRHICLFLSILASLVEPGNLHLPLFYRYTYTCSHIFLQNMFSLEFIPRPSSFCAASSTHEFNV